MVGADWCGTHLAEVPLLSQLRRKCGVYFTPDALSASLPVLYSYRIAIDHITLHRIHILNSTEGCLIIIIIITYKSVPYKTSLSLPKNCGILKEDEKRGTCAECLLLNAFSIFDPLYREVH